MSDQQRADSLGCFGNKMARTPHLDALARHGAVLRNHFTPNQICSPSRATLFSGLYPRHHGLTRNGIGLPQEVELITHALKSSGYRTHGVGKFHFQPILAPAEYAMPDSNAFWSLPESQGWRGPFFGFDTVDIVIGESAAVIEAGHYASWLKTTAPEAVSLYLPEHALGPRPDDLDEVWKCAVPEELHYNNWIADRACAFLQEVDRRAPFFLFVSFPDPHHPFSPPAPWCDLFDPASVPPPAHVPGELDLMPDYIVADRGEEEEQEGRSYLEYLLDPGPPREQGFMQTTERFSAKTIQQAIAHTYGVVSMIDDCVGRILGTISTLSLSDDTIVVFTSDHGELLGDHGLIRKGAVPYRQLLHVPMIMAGPSIAPGSRQQVTSHLDIKATLLDLAGAEGNEGDGVSFASLLRDPDAPGRRLLFAEYHPRADPEQYNQTMLNQDWRLTVYPLRPDWGELFDWRVDPAEHRNRYFDPTYEDVRGELSQELDRHWPPAPDAGLKAIAVY